MPATELTPAARRALRARAHALHPTIGAAWRELDIAKNDIERNNYLIRDILGEYDIHDNFYNGNTLEASLKLMDELVAKPKGPGKTIEDIRQRAESVVRVAAASQQTLAALSFQSAKHHQPPSFDLRRAQNGKPRATHLVAD